MAGKWRHVACLWDLFVRGTVGGRFKKGKRAKEGEKKKETKKEKNGPLQII